MRWLLLFVCVLPACAPVTIEGAFSKAREAQGAAERRVDTTIREVLKLMCDMDVKRVNELSKTEPGFSYMFWERCGADFQHVIDGAVAYRNANKPVTPE